MTDRVIDLVGELCEAQASLMRSRADHLALASAGVPFLVRVLGFVGSARISLSEDQQTWQPGGEHHAFITPCRILHPHTPEAEEPSVVVQYGDLVDLVAWHPAAPSRWALRTGFASWLGACEPQHCSALVRVRRSPLAWLKAGCDGLVALEHTAEGRQRTLSFAQMLVAEDLEHAQELRQLMERPICIPNVRVGEPSHERGARTVEA